MHTSDPFTINSVNLFLCRCARVSILVGTPAKARGAAAAAEPVTLDAIVRSYLRTTQAEKMRETCETLPPFSLLAPPLLKVDAAVFAFFEAVFG